MYKVQKECEMTWQELGHGKKKALKELFDNLLILGKGGKRERYVMS